MSPIPCGPVRVQRPQTPARGAPAIRRRALLALLATGSVAPRLALSGDSGEVPVGGRLRDAPLQGLNGPSRRLAQFRGRALLINVWASWCGPCIEEMASIERLAWLEGRPPFAMIGVSTDDDPEPARAFLRRSNATINHYIDQAQQVENMLGASHIPLTVLVDAGGRVLEKIYGAREWDDPASLRLLEDTFGRGRAVALR